MEDELQDATVDGENQQGPILKAEYLDGDCEQAFSITRAGKARVTYSNGDIFEGNKFLKQWIRQFNQL